jgi:spore coat protein U-like protein
MNKMKWILAVVAMAAVALPGFSATTGTLLLQGTVPGILEISVAALPAASALDLTANQANLPVANVTERSNRKAGYTVTLQSVNSGAGNAFFFKSADLLNLDTLAYTLSYDGAPVSLVAGTALITDALAKTPAAGVVKGLAISYSGAASYLNEDAYADTLTFTITAK